MGPRATFYGLLGALAVTLGVVCACEPVLGDSWGYFVDARVPLTWDRLVAFVDNQYTAGNPRWGQLVLMIMFHEPVVAIVLTPIAIIATLLLSMTLVRARWLRPTDGWLLVQTLALAIGTLPQFGALWFYRPNCTNYIYPLAFQLAWLVPYRFLAARPLARSHARTIAIVPLGFLAGAGNEHTGIALAAAAVAATWVAFRRDRAFPPWTILGLVSLIAGYHTLLTAPGQMVRYSGLATSHSPLETIASRGWGNVAFAAILLAWASPAILLAVVGARQRLAPPTPAMLACFGVAALMVATSLASPLVPPRLLAAPATMVALALGMALDGAGRRVRIACAALASLSLAIALVIALVTGLEGRARVAELASAPGGSVVCAAPYTFESPTPFSWGDDFRSAKLVERVAVMFGLERIDRVCR